MILKSSNPYKISEYKRLLANTDISIEKGEDLREVLGSINEVIIYKAIDAGENVLVEDATLIINGVEEVEIKWKLDSLKTGDEVTWIISLGILNNGIIRVYQGSIDVIVDRSLGMDGVAFEPFFVPIENNPDKLSYTVLAKTINKDIIDPRAKAVSKLLNGKIDIVAEREDFPTWTGAYQND